ncbi:hypothetical protein LSCM1_03484 [Leishmania martiniquensis]|uniref:Uncharacterized protein n=1 Tax=Leishmania martiniquensis TaxID=1580590 RepID=A0A836KIE3_9TRYP|nr:hypothetical protein LSCM1_03484 [Leishmania martiniquensis]
MQSSKAPRPPPPRRVPPGAAMTKDASSDTYLSTHILLRLSGAALISQQLLQVKDWTSDIKMAVVTADDSLKAISKNLCVRPPSLRDDATTGGDDVQSLAFASKALLKLAQEEEAQDAFYAKLRETATVRAEMQRGSQDATLQQYKQQVECQLASSMADCRLPPQVRRSSLPLQEHQLLLNPYSAARRQLLSTAPTALSGGKIASPSVNLLAATTGVSSTSMPATITAPYRSSTFNAATQQQSPLRSSPASRRGANSSLSSASPSASGTWSGVQTRYDSTATAQQPAQQPARTPQPVAHGACSGTSRPQRGSATGGVHTGHPKQKLSQNRRQSSQSNYSPL